MRPDLLELFEVSELKKYMTDEELAGLARARHRPASAREEGEER